MAMTVRSAATALTPADISWPAARLVHLPHRSIDEESTAQFSKDKVIVTYCWGPACNASTKGALRFARLGFRVKEMIGGLEYWQREGHPVEGTKV